MIRSLVLALLMTGCTSVVEFTTPLELGEQCADGVDNDGNGSSDCDDASCAMFPACAETCGNGRLDPGEECDDNNRLPDDGCGPECTIDEGCGNEVVDPNEQCDDGNDADNDGCLRTCREAACGDGIVQVGVEACDDGNTDDTDACLTGCVAATCGDGIVQAGAEQCDDANANANDGCAGCVIERCGDNTTQIGPAVTQLDFEWLASSCAGFADLVVTINGVVVLETLGAPETCNCAPEGGSQFLTTKDPQILGLLVDGPNRVEAEYTGAGHFLAWAMVTVHTGSTSTEIVVHEGAPGVAKARVDSLCSGGFDENVPAKLATQAVSVFEECDDGNTVDDDACSNSCRTLVPSACTIPSGALLAWDLDIPLGADFNQQSEVPYRIDNRLTLGGTSFARVAYCMQLDTTFVYTEMDDFTGGKVQDTGLPTENIFDTAVTNLTIRTNVAGVTEVTDATGGKIELWSNCYGEGLNLYDVDDDIDLTAPDCYGSFQIHHDTTTALSYNRWSGGGTSEGGIGNQPTGHPDFTFAQNFGAFTTRRVQGFILP